MSQSGFLRSGVIPGALGGRVGGLVFGAARIEIGDLDSVASLIRLESPVIGGARHLVIAMIIGTGLGVLLWHQRPGVGETLFWGVVYGTLWWFIGPLTLAPTVLSETPAWTASTAQGAFPALIGHILYGSSTALAIVFIRLQDLRGDLGAKPTSGAVLRGALVELLAAWLVGPVLAAQGTLPAFSANFAAESRVATWSLILMTGLVAGAIFAILYPRPRESVGASLVRGAMFGVLVWIVLPMSVLTAIQTGDLSWSLVEARIAFVVFPRYVLFGALIGLLYQWAEFVVRLLFDDSISSNEHEGVGTQGLRAIGGGMDQRARRRCPIRTDDAPDRRVDQGGRPDRVYIAHRRFRIAFTVGASYGLLFRKQSYDLGSGIGWGASYGFVWWNIGPLTLMPAFLGTTPVWSAETAASVFPNLVGHLVYGAGVGATFHLLESRYNPWWVPQRQAQAERLEQRKRQVLTSAPAIWTLVVVIALTLPVLLGTVEIAEIPEPI